MKKNIAAFLVGSGILFGVAALGDMITGSRAAQPKQTKCTPVEGESVSPADWCDLLGEKSSQQVFHIWLNPNGQPVEFTPSPRATGHLALMACYVTTDSAGNGTTVHLGKLNDNEHKTGRHVPIKPGQCGVVADGLGSGYVQLIGNEDAPDARGAQLTVTAWYN